MFSWLASIADTTDAFASFIAMPAPFCRQNFPCGTHSRTPQVPSYAYRAACQMNACGPAVIVPLSGVCTLLLRGARFPHRRESSVKFLFLNWLQLFFRSPSSSRFHGPVFPAMM